MEVLFEVERNKLSKTKDVLLRDDIVSRASVLFKDASTFDIKRDVYFVYVAGLEEACKKTKDLMKDLGKEVEKKLKEEIIAKIKEEEDSAATGFGAIFG
jgi:hypothetical protein